MARVKRKHNEALAKSDGKHRNIRRDARKQKTKVFYRSQRRIPFVSELVGKTLCWNTCYCNDSQKRKHGRRKVRIIKILIRSIAGLWQTFYHSFNRSIGKIRNHMESI